MPSKKYGEEVCACVILKEGEDMTEEEIKAYYKENVAFFKIPKYVWIMDEFPMTASGKSRNSFCATWRSKNIRFRATTQ